MNLHWKHLNYHGNGKSHCLPEAFVNGIRADMEERNARHNGGVSTVPDIDDAISHLLDPGGACFVGAPRETFKLAGLKVYIVCSDVEFFLERAEVLLKETRVREVDGRRYVKLHGAWQVLVIPWELLGRFVRQLKARVPKANERDRVWWKAHQKKMGKVEQPVSREE